MTKYKIEQDLNECIGCMACQSVAEDLWEQKEIDDAFKAVPTKTELNEDELDKAKESAEICPVQCIHIKNLDTGEEVK